MLNTPFSPVNGAQYATQGRTRTKRNSIRQAIDLQSIAYHDCKATDTPVHVRAALMRAWCDLQETVSNMRGYGKPRPVTARNDPDSAKARKARKVVIEPYPAPVDEKNA